MRETTVAIKGVKDGLLITISPTEEWSIVTGDLAARIDEKPSFFTGSKITIEAGERPVPKDQLAGLKALLERRGLTLWAVSSESPTTIDAADALDLHTHKNTNHAGLPTKPAPDDDDVALPTRLDDDAGPGILIRRTIRSGRLVHSQGHVVVVGDVNPGAEIIAVGDVIVWGRLRGNVHAGADGDESAVVCALDMMPTQLRIAGYITTSPDDKRRKPRPEIALIRDSQIVVEQWK